METRIVIVTSKTNALHNLVAATALTSFTSILMFFNLPNTYRIALALTTSIPILISLYRLASNIKAEHAAKEAKAMLLDLLLDGIEVEKGLVTLASRYTGEAPLNRCYTTTLSFKSDGSSEVLTLSRVENITSEYILAIKEDEGILIAKAFKLNIDDHNFMIVPLHTRVEAKVQRKTLHVRYGGDAAEAKVVTEGPNLDIVASHVGEHTYARIVLEVQAPFELVLHSVKFRNRSLHTTLRLAPTKPHLLIIMGKPSISDLALSLGVRKRTIVYGVGVEMRLKLELVRRKHVVAHTETMVRSVKSYS